MPVRGTVTEKLDVIASILENSVYMPESGMVKKLTNALLPLSLDNLNSLNLIVSMDRVLPAKKTGRKSK